MRKPSLEDLLFVLGEMCISGGVFMVYVPAGVVATGILLILTSIAISRGEPKK